MQASVDWLQNEHSSLVQDLTRLVSIPCISTDGEHEKEIKQCAEVVCEQMQSAGLNNVQQSTSGNSYPYCYGEWIEAPDKPTVFLYSHYDVQPINYRDQWLSDPWTLTERDGRLYARGSADDKAAITTHLAAIASYLKTQGSLPVNVKMVVEGEEEIGSENLMSFFEQERERIQSDIILVCDTENIDTGIPSITYSLRGVITLKVDVESAGLPVHSGMAGGALADAALALNVILSRLYWDKGAIPVPGLYDNVKPMTDAERKAMEALPADEAEWRKDFGIPEGVQLANETGVHPYEATWRKPSITLIAQEASSIKSASNQVLPRASALVSCRIVPHQEPEQVMEAILSCLRKDTPWGVKVKVEPYGASVKSWMTDPTGPAFEAAMSALKAGFDRDPVAIGCGGTIGFVGPLAELLGGAPALLLGIEDPKTNAHAPNESLHSDDWRKLMKSLAHLFDNLGKLPGGKVK